MNKGLKKVLSYTLITTMVVSMALTNFGGMGASVVKAEGEPLDSASLVNFSTILGRAVDFGITAVELDQNGSHSETNMAVKTFTASQNNDDPDLAGDQPLPFIIGSINGRLDLQNTYQNGKMTINIETTKEIIDNSIIINNGGSESDGGFHTGEGYISIKDGNAAHSTPVTPDANGYYYYGNDSQGFTTVYRESTQENINNNLDLMISHIQDQSGDLKAKTTNVDLTAAEAMDQNNYLIDLSDPKYDGKVVYINVDAVNYPKLAEHFKAGNAHNLKIKKWNSTVVVFNVPNTTTKINPIKVEVVDDGINEPEGGWFNSANTGGGQDNASIDEYVCQKVVLNLYNATEVHLNAVAGTVLVPKENSETYIEGSSAGWIASAGKVTNVSAEFHFIYQGRSTTLSSNANGAMHFAARKDIYSEVDTDGKPVERDDIGISANQFKFNLYETTSDYNTTGKDPIKTNDSDASSAANDEYSKILFPDLSFSEAGTHYYVIKEVDAGTTANRITNSNGEIRIKLVVAKSDTGVISFTVSSWHYLNSTNFDTSAAYKINDSKAMIGNEFSLGGFYNYYEPGGTLTVTKTISGTDSAYAPTTDRFKITLTGVVSSANLSGTYNVSGDAYAAATGTDKLSSITFTNGTSGDFYIAGGGSVSVIDIPAGAVITVAEEDKANYDRQTTDLSKTMVSGQTDTVALDNRYTAPKGYLKFTKTFTGITSAQIPTGVVFKIYNSLDTTTPIKTLNWTDLTKSNGDLTGTWTPTDASDALPVGTYIVKEFVGASTTEGIPITSYSVTVTGNGSTGVEVTTSSNGSVDDAADLNLNNAYTATNTANLSITKKVTGNSTKEGADFYVTVKGADNNYYNTNGIIVNENNARTAVRAGTNGNQGAAVVFSNLPLQTYTVTEEDASISGYSLTTSYDGVVGTSGSAVLNSADATVNYPIINEYTELKGYLKFTKTFTGITSGQIPSGVVFKIYNSSNQVVKTLSWSDLTKSGNGLVGTWNPSDASEALPLGTYTVKEFVNSTTSDEGIPIANYSVAVTGNVSTGVAVESSNNSAENAAELELTNTYTLQTGSLSITKSQAVGSDAFDDTVEFTVNLTGLNSDDSNLTGDFAATNVTGNKVTFATNGTASFTITKGQTVTISGLPNGSKITVAEAAKTNYTYTTDPSTSPIVINASATQPQTVELLNTYTAPKGYLKFTKTFAGITANQIPTGVVFKIYNSTGTLVETLNWSALTKSNNDLTGTWTSTNPLPVGTYTVQEYVSTSTTPGVPITGYEVVVGGNGGTGVEVETSNSAPASAAELTLTNTYTQNGSITVTKAVSGLEGTATLPSNYAITYYNGTTQMGVLTTSDTGCTGTGATSDPYTWTISNVSAGQTLTFVESNYNVTGYDLAITTTPAAVTNEPDKVVSPAVVSGGNVTVAFTNTYTRKKTTATLNKVWNDATDMTNRPNELTVKLLANGTQVGSDIVLSSTNPNAGLTISGTDNSEWTYVLSDLDEYDDSGNLIDYTFEEVCPSPYTLTGNVTGGNETTLTNTYPAPESAKLSITKTVTGNTAKDGGTFYVTVKGEDNKYYNTSGVVVAASAARTAITAGTGGAAGTAVVFNNLPLQTYTVTEEDASATGYLLTTQYNGTEGTSGSVVLDTADATVDCAILNAYTGIGSLKVEKVLDTTGDTPSTSDSFTINVVFDTAGTYTVTEHKAVGVSNYSDTFTVNSAKSYTLGLDEWVEISNVTAGVGYTVTEGDLTGTNYTNTSITNNGTGTISQGTTASIDVTNKYTAPAPILGQINLTKAIAGDLDTSSSLVSGKTFTFTVTGPTGWGPVNVTLGNGTWSDSTTLVNLPLGDYTIVEADASIQGYNLAVSNNNSTVVNITDATPVDCTITNTYTTSSTTITPVDLTIKKVKEGGEGLAGAVLRVEKADGTEVTTFTSVAAGNTVSLSEAGDYKLIEVTPPADYQKAADMTFKVIDDGNGNLSVVDASNNAITSITMTDALVPKHKMHFSKVDVYNLKEIAGAQLTLYSVNGTGALTEKVSWTSSATSVYEFELEAGNYAIKETVAPDGYVLAQSLVRFTLSFDTNGNAVINVTEGPGTYDATADVIKFENDPIKVYGKLSVHVEEKKTGRPVPDAEVEVTGPDGKTTTYKTNGDGEIVDANGNTPIDVPAGTYKIKIKSVPKGYDVDTGEVGDVTVPENGEGRHIAKIVSSTGGLKIKVLEEGTKREVPDATVVVEAPEGVKFPDGSTKITAITDKNGNITTYTGADGKTYDLTSGLTPGDYKITVTKVPAGYNVTVGETKTCKVVKDEIAEHVALIATSSSVQPAPAPAPAATPASTPATSTGSITNSINVKTGDDMNVYPALIAMALSLITGVAVVAFRRKRETK